MFYKTIIGFYNKLHQKDIFINKQLLCKHIKLIVKINLILVNELQTNEYSKRTKEKFYKTLSSKGNG